MTTLVLAAWPVLTLVLVLRLPIQKAILFSLIGGFLLLPTGTGWDLPLLPPFNKDTIPALTLLVLALVLQGQRGPGADTPRLPGWVPRSRPAIALLALLMLGAQMTALTNAERLTYGPTVLPGLRPYDGFSLILSSLTLLVPLFLGRKFFAHHQSQILLLKGLVFAGLAYSLLALFEIRMSPQLNNMVYGFFPHDWRQHIRGGGWRPIVFMEHGLQLALFFATVTLVAFGASRCLEPQSRRVYLLAGVWLLGTLVLSNSLGALVLALLFIPAVLFLGIRGQLLFAAIVAGTVVLYPMLRGADLIPTERMVSMVETINYDRSRSLNFRFWNDDRLLEHAQQKALFGWGGWNRNRVFDERGRDTTTTDGAWIVVIGTRGWIGYIAQFGLLSLPVLLLAYRRRSYQVSAVTATLALALALALADLLFNGFLSPVTLLVAGALWGRWEMGMATEDDAQTAEAAASDHGAYARPVPANRPSVAGTAPVADHGKGASIYTRQTVRRVRRQHFQ